MRSAIAVLSALPLLFSSVVGLPMKRQAAANSTVDPNNLLVLKFANLLEQLETDFYTQALAKFQPSDFTTAGFAVPDVAIQQFQTILSDESTHTDVLASTIQSLGDEAITGCSFDFTAVLESVSTMAPVARLVEYVGVCAYLGAAHLVSDPVILTAAASIVTVEARHQTILNVLNGQTAIPQAFDLALLPQEVLALAGSFISGCSAGIDSLPPLTVTNTESIQAGTSLTFQADALSSISDTSTLSCQMLAGGMPFSLSLPFNECVVPQNLTGPVAIYVTNNTQPLNNNARDKFLGNVVAGPTIQFIDNKPEVLAALAVNGTAGASSDSSSSDSASETSTGSVSSSTTTSTITPESASSIVSGASATATVAGAVGGSNNAANVPSTANSATGPSSDGSLTVEGWSNVPAPASS